MTEEKDTIFEEQKKQHSLSEEDKLAFSEWFSSYLDQIILRQGRDD